MLIKYAYTLFFQWEKEMVQLVLSIIHYKDSSSREFQNSKPMKHFTDFLKQVWGSRNFYKEGKNNQKCDFNINTDLGR